MMYFGEMALADLEGVDLIVTTGGLGPTADDMTLACVARFCGRELTLDEAMEARIAAIVASPLVIRARRCSGSITAPKPCSMLLLARRP